MATQASAHVTYITPDITCGHCVSKVQDALRQLGGVLDVHANVETRMVDVAFDPAVVSPDRIQQVLAEAGYPTRD